MRAVISLLLWLWGVVVVVLCFVSTVAAFICTAPFDKGRYWVGRAGRVTSRLLVAINPFWRFGWAGTRPANPRKPYVVVSNHESNFDPFLLSFLPFEMKFLSKVSLFRLPFFGWAMWLAGDIGVDRGDKKDRGASLRKCAAVLRNRVSVMIFPEGTRARTPDMLPFKTGAFRLAIESGCDVLPLGLAGTRDALPKGSWLFGTAHARVVIGEPIPVAGLTPDDAPALAERARAAIEALRARARAA